MLSIIIAHANLNWKTNGGFLRSYTVTSSLTSVILHACSEFCVRFWDCPLVRYDNAKYDPEDDDTAPPLPNQV